MAKVIPGRMSARLSGDEADGGFVVFRIGMRLNHWWKPRLGVSAFRAMVRMLAELSKQPELGLFGYSVGFESGGPAVTQWWTSTEKLLAYAAANENQHLPAWREFRRLAAKSGGAVGIWHETYVVGEVEAFYGDMPRMGMAKAGELVPIGEMGNTAKRRLAAPASK